MKNSKSLRKWLDHMNLSHPLLIAGPCSAETEVQVLDIANQLKDSDATIYRAGIWKPRTRPGNFEGVGALALEWLKNVKKETGILLGSLVNFPVCFLGDLEKYKDKLRKITDEYPYQNERGETI